MNGHPTREEDFDLYALGALEGEEKQAIESHVAQCGACSRKLAEAQGRIALLVLGAPPVDPSPAVKERLMRQVHASAEGRTSRTGSVEPEHAGVFFGRWWAAVLAPAAMALALAAVFLWNQNTQLDRQLADLRTRVEQQQKELQQAREIADLVEAKDTMVVTLAKQPGMPEGSARVLYNARLGTMLYDGTLAPAPADKSYQLWLVPKSGSPISAGVFNPAAGEKSHMMVKMQQGMEPKAFAVTLEPAGGMPQPTGAMVLVGPVS
jgi:anti-sigma-K factor RskA